MGYFALGTPHSLDAVRDRRPAARTATLTNQRRRWESPECVSAGHSISRARSTGKP